MPPITRFRRRSSVRLNGLAHSNIKAGNYGISPRNISFAPNITPISYTAPEDDDDDLYLPSPSNAHSSTNDASNHPSSTAKLFPPSSTPAPPPTRKRCPPGKRRSQGYIPRPPNAFMLFRADFVRQKHVPGSIETNHGSLSKIIGNCWRALPLEEKKIWEVKARHEKAAHKLAYPDYRFRPVHNKNKDKDKDALRGDAARKGGRAGQGQEEDERRCEEVAQLLLEGKKGEELALAVKHLDQAREASSQENSPVSAVQQLSLPPPSHHHHDLVMPIPMQGSFLQPLPQSNGMYHRRSSSVPLPNDFFLAQYTNTAQTHHNPIPSLPFALTQTLSRPTSPVPSISRHFMAQPLPYQHNSTAFAPSGSFPSQPQPPSHSQTQTQVQTNRASFLSSHRRASSVGGPFLRRSWTLPSGWGSSMGIEEYGMDLSSMVDMGDYMGAGIGGLGVGMGMGMNGMNGMSMSGMDYSAAMAMERDPSPLPDVDNSLFSDFTFGSAVHGHGQVHGGMMKEEAPHPAPVPTAQEEGIAPHARMSPSASVSVGVSVSAGLHLEIDPTHSWAYDPALSSASTSLSHSTAASVYSDPGSPPFISTSDSTTTASNTTSGAPDKTPTTGEFSMSLAQMDMGMHALTHTHTHTHLQEQPAYPSYEAWTQQHQDGFAQGACHDHDQFGMGVGMGMEGNTEGGFGAFGQGYGI